MEVRITEPPKYRGFYETPCQFCGHDVLICETKAPKVEELYLGGSATIASSSTSTSTPSGMNPETK